MPLVRTGYRWCSAAPATLGEAVFVGPQRAASTVARIVPVGLDGVGLAEMAGQAPKRAFVAAMAGMCVSAAGG